MTSSPVPSIPWKKGPLVGPAGTSGVLASADYAIVRLRDLRIPFPSNSRLVRARALVAAVHQNHSLPADPALLVEATRTIFEVYWIARALGAERGRPDEELTRRLARMLGGPDLPDDEDENSSRARNTQFELYVGAWLTAGGVEVRLGEPDLIARIPIEEVGIAVKRIRSRGKILRRVKEAADQVERRTGTGIVAVSVDHLLDELPENLDPELLGRQFDEAFPEFDEALAVLAERPGIKGLLALGMRLRWSPDAKPPQLDMGLFNKWRALVRSDAEADAMNEFWKRFSEVQADRLARF